MFGRDKRRFLEGKPIEMASGLTTVVGEGAVFVGEFVTTGDAVIAGEVRGTVEAGGRLYLRASGSVLGAITAGDAKIEGAVEGPIVVPGKLEIGVTARVLGDVRAGRLAIAEGSLVQGNLHTETAPHHFIEGRLGGSGQADELEEEAREQTVGV